MAPLNILLAYSGPDSALALPKWMVTRPESWKQDLHLDTYVCCAGVQARSMVVRPKWFPWSEPTKLRPKYMTLPRQPRPGWEKCVAANSLLAALDPQRAAAE